MSVLLCCVGVPAPSVLPVFRAAPLAWLRPKVVDPHLLRTAAAEPAVDLVVLVTYAERDVVAQCALVREVARVPVLVWGPADSVLHLEAGADMCVPATVTDVVLFAYMESLLRRWGGSAAAPPARTERDNRSRRLPWVAVKEGVLV